MINGYVIEPHWANWMLVIEMFVSGVAAGTFFFIAIANFAGGPGKAEDREVAARAGFVPFPLMLLVGLLLIVDLGEPGRFLNLIVRSPFAPERGPGPLMFNANSPMSWGTLVILVFGAFATVAFLDALWHTRRFRAVSLVETVSHNPIWLGIGAFFAAATALYSGVLLNVTNQNVWGDTVLLGTLYMAFSALSGMAVGAIVADRQGAVRTAAAVRTGLLWFAAVAGVVLLLFVINLAAVGRASPLIADLDQIVAPVFWIGVVGLAIAYPIFVLWDRGPRTTSGGRGARAALTVAGYDMTRLAIVGTVVLLGVLAFRYAILFSALAATQ